MPAAFRGFLDFVGYPVGGALSIPRGAPVGAGRRIYTNVLMSEAYQESVLDGMRTEAVIAMLKRSSLLRKLERQLEEQHHKQVVANAVYTALLSEV